MARRPPSPVTQAPALTPAEKRSAIERITRRIDQLRTFDSFSVTMRRSPEVVKLETDIEETLSGIFGSRTDRYNRYRQAADLEPPPPAPVLQVPDWIAARGGGGDTQRGENIDELRKQINERRHRAIILLQSAAQGFEEEIEHEVEAKGPEVARDLSGPDSGSRKIFLVHGRDDAAKNEVALFLRAIGLVPIILHLRPNGGRHLLTKFTEESEGAGFAVVLMTPDDEGGLSGSDDRRPRARQNVVFELGFFIGRLGPAKVAALLKGDVEKPSDFDGIAYIGLDPSGRWKTDLARELHHANVPFDPAKAFTA
jgi:predicted nucleotide-binding protein